MRVLITLLKKEFKQIFRNRIMIPIIFVVPLIQMIVLVYAASLDMKNINTVVVDHDLSDASRRLVSHFEGSPYFTVTGSTISYQEAEAEIIQDKATLVIRIPEGFEKELLVEQSTELQLVINAINATEAGLTGAYAAQIIQDYNREIRLEWFGLGTQGKLMEMDLSVAYWYNPLLDYKIYMISGVLVIVVTLVGMFLTALNLVTEKELGTAEQMNVTPMRKVHFLLAKLIPFLILGLIVFSVGLLIGKFLFGLPIIGSLPLLFTMVTIYLFVALGIGLFLSTISNTQQQLMFISFFFLIAFVLMSGIFTPAESMPVWAQKINLLNPTAYLMKSIRMILLKGSAFADVAREFYSLLIYALAIMSLAVFNYRKTS